MEHRPIEPNPVKNKVRLILANLKTGERAELKIPLNCKMAELYIHLRITTGFIYRNENTIIAPESTPITLQLTDGEQLDYCQTHFSEKLRVFVTNIDTGRSLELLIPEDLPLNELYNDLEISASGYLKHEGLLLPRNETPRSLSLPSGVKLMYCKDEPIITFVISDKGTKSEDEVIKMRYDQHFEQIFEHYNAQGLSPADCYTFLFINGRKILPTDTPRSLKCANGAIIKKLTIHQGVLLEIPYNQLKIDPKSLKEGGFGILYRAYWGSIPVAIKRIKNAIFAPNWPAEANSLALLNCEHIIRLMGITVDADTQTDILVMEFFNHGSLDDYLFVKKKVLSIPEVIRLALDIAHGIEYLHNNDILHRDLKSANVLLYRDTSPWLRATLTDFGLAKFLLPNGKASSVVGTLTMMPPEILSEKPYHKPVDVFSFGVILYEMLTGKRIKHVEEPERITMIKKNIKEEALQGIAIDCCKTEPEDRPIIAIVIDLLQTHLNKFDNDFNF